MGRAWRRPDWLVFLFHAMGHICCGFSSRSHHHHYRHRWMCRMRSSKAINHTVLGISDDHIIEYLIGDTVTGESGDNCDSDIQNYGARSASPRNSRLSGGNPRCESEGSGGDYALKKKLSAALQDYHPALRNVSMRLEGSSLWNKFHAFGTEMIVTKTGR
ncbi:unnamed protein product [Gongylonema pulchrum]|uniref:T-box domain-containing protein n=1 Tax=Gongylonema pulchrum TaxID=637853 RepID=A0A183DEE5_9BILA|nr:unnamed protein product [Gongylonema pulchrum]